MLGTVSVLSAGSVACTAEPPDPGPVEWAWHEVTLPAAPAGERVTLRAGAVCDGQWYLAGAFGGAADATRPAAWTSEDGTTWTELSVAAHSYYGVRSEYSTVACREGRLVALGGKPGGAHGNPRMATYHFVPAADGSPVLTEVDAYFDLYGGPFANNVGRMTSGPHGYLMVGNRVAGAAVWLSPDGAKFEIIEGAAGLATGPAGISWAADASPHDGDWVVVGGLLAPGRTDRDAAAWRSPDGRSWTPMAAESDPVAYDEMSVVAEQDGTLVGVGSNGTTFQSWRLEQDSWRLAGRFGSTEATPIDNRWTPVIAADLAAVGEHLLAAVIFNGAYHLWYSGDGGRGWRPAASPIPMPSGAARGAAIVGIPGTGGTPDQILLAVDDGTGGRAFLTTLAPAGD